MTTSTHFLRYWAIALLLLAAFSTTLSAQTKKIFTGQHYLGTWTGISKQEPGAPRALYSYTLVFHTVEQPC